MIQIAGGIILAAIFIALLPIILTVAMFAIPVIIGLAILIAIGSAYGFWAAFIVFWIGFFLIGYIIDRNY